MSVYPLIFTFADTIAGNGFLARIVLSGRATMALEEDGVWWMYGVCPGAISDSGETPQEAYLRFRNTYKALLFDFAEEVTTFDAFKNEVSHFLFEGDAEEEQRWTQSVEALRSGAMAVAAPFSDLPRERPEDHCPNVKVERLDASKQFTAKDNVSDTYAIPIAA